VAFFYRLLADAKFLHQKLSVLKNVGAQSGMLETIITEKNVTRKSPETSSQQPGTVPFRQNSISTASALRGPVLTANQRLQGIFKSTPKPPLPSPIENAIPSPIIREKSPPSSVSDTVQISGDRPMDGSSKDEASQVMSHPPVTDPPEGRKSGLIEAVEEQQKETGTAEELTTENIPRETSGSVAGETSETLDGLRNRVDEAPSIAS
jgi:hypothetical protein